MRKSVLLLFGVLLALALPTAGLAAPLCMSLGGPTGPSLQDLITASATGGCTMGGVTYSTWEFSNANSSPGTTPLNASQIDVDFTYSMGAGYGVTFSGKPATGNFHVTGNVHNDYRINYVMTMAREAADFKDLVLSMDPENTISDPGNINLSKYGCLGGAFVRNPDTGVYQCRGTMVGLNTYHVPGDEVLVNGTTFAPQMRIGIQDVLYLSGNVDHGVTGSAYLGWFSDSLAVPEPASLLLIGAGLVGLGLLRRRMA